MLEFETFKFASDVTVFVNQNDIQQGDIQALFHDEHSNTYYLYYWS